MIETDYVTLKECSGIIAKELSDATFDTALDRLPSADFVTDRIQTDSADWSSHFYDFDKSMRTGLIRTEYLKQSFPILTDEWLMDLAAMILSLGPSIRIAEVCCGIGWLSHWLRTYGVFVTDSIDDMSWMHYKECQYQSFVRKADAVEYMQSGNNDLVILSWPYMDDIALLVWKALDVGQYLLYIGEGCGGCTGSDEFFEEVNDNEVDDGFLLGRSFLSFSGIHDRPVLYRKPGR